MGSSSTFKTSLPHDPQAQHPRCLQPSRSTIAFCIRSQLSYHQLFPLFILHTVLLYTYFFPILTFWYFAYSSNFKQLSLPYFYGWHFESCTKSNTKTKFWSTKTKHVYMFYTLPHIFLYQFFCGVVEDGRYKAYKVNYTYQKCR